MLQSLRGDVAFISLVRTSLSTTQPYMEARKGNMDLEDGRTTILLLYFLEFNEIRLYSAFSFHFPSNLCASVHGIPSLCGMFYLNVSFQTLLLLILEGPCQFPFSLTNHLSPPEALSAKAPWIGKYYLISIKYLVRFLKFE